MNLYPHQIDVLKATESNNRVAYYLDMGLGKTFVGAEKLHRLGTRLNLVVCQKSKINDWVDHFKQNYSDLNVFDLTNHIEFEAFLDAVNTSEGNIIGCVNYELLWRRKRLSALNNFTLLLDESSLIQNDKAKQTKCIMKLDAENVILLSGTPVSGKYENLWTQAKLLGWEIPKRTYENQYINYKLVDFGTGIKVRTVNKKHPYKNVERLKRKLREHGAVFMKTEEVMNLPEQTFITVNVDCTNAYKKFMKNDYIMINPSDGGEFVDESDYMGTDVRPRIELIATTSLNKRLYSRQLSSLFNMNKQTALIDLIKSTNDRLIVFYNFNAELEMLKGICGALKRPVSEVNGNCKDFYAYDNFDCSITLVQYQAGAMGINLQKANKIIYFSLPERSELFEQSKKRIHRIGQSKPCFYYLLIAENTVDEAIYECLQKRKDFTDELFKEVDNG